MQSKDFVHFCVVCSNRSFYFTEIRGEFFLRFLLIFD